MSQFKPSAVARPKRVNIVTEVWEFMKVTYPMWIAFTLELSIVLHVIGITPYLNQNWFRAYCLLVIPMLLVLYPFALLATKRLDAAQQFINHNRRGVDTDVQNI